LVFLIDFFYLKYYPFFSCFLIFGDFEKLMLKTIIKIMKFIVKFFVYIMFKELAYFKKFLFFILEFILLPEDFLRKFRNRFL
jgi:hypothetical protein